MFAQHWQDPNRTPNLETNLGQEADQISGPWCFIRFMGSGLSQRPTRRWQLARPRCLRYETTIGTPRLPYGA